MIRRAFLLNTTATLAIIGSAVPANAILFSGGSSSPPPTPGTIPVSFNNLAPSTSYTTPTVSFFQPFKDGDVAGGGSVTAVDSLGSPVTVQMDQIGTWPSGYMSGAVLTIAMSETCAGGSSKAYTLTTSASARNTTLNAGWSGSVTSANVPDIRVQYSGGDAGANVYTVKLRDIMTNFTAYPWGTSFPKGGYRIIKSGPNCVEIHAWQYLINDATGFTQGYVRCDMWVKVIGGPSGACEVDVRTSAPNIWNTIATNSERYNLYPGRFAANVVILNGATPVSYFGGPNDVRAGAVTFNSGTQKITFGSTALRQTGMIFTSTGTLPGGISANTIYWVDTNNDIFIDRYWLSESEIGFPTPFPAWAAGVYAAGARCTSGGGKYYSQTGGTATTTPTGNTFTDGTLFWQRINPDLTTNGTGTITASPIYASFQECGWQTGDINGDPVWVGTGTKPRIFPGHDHDYLFASKAVPPYNKTALTATTNNGIPSFVPNQLAGGLQWQQNATGDSPGDQRIGHIDNFGVVALYMPQDPFYTTASIQAALSWNNSNCCFWYDERNGLPFASDNGPNNGGVAYTNYPSPTVGASWAQTGLPGINYLGAPAAPGNSWVSFYDTVPGASGLQSQYWYDGSHCPMNMQVPFLKTGRTCFEDQMVSYSNAITSLSYYPYTTYNGTATYSAVNVNSQQTRAWAWDFRTMCQALFFCSDNQPSKPLLQNSYKSHINFQAYIMTNTPSQAKVFGILHDAHTVSDGQYAPWQYHFLDTVVSMEKWRGGLVAGVITDITTMFDYMSKHYDTFKSGYEYYVGGYYFQAFSAPGDFTSAFTTQAGAFSVNPVGSWKNPPPPANVVNGLSSGPDFALTDPHNVTDYPYIAQFAMKVRSIAGDSSVDTLRATVSQYITNGTGIATNQGGALWSYASSGVTNNYEVFSAW
jgi:hypothetical protein